MDIVHPTDMIDDSIPDDGYHAQHFVEGRKKNDRDDCALNDSWDVRILIVDFKEFQDAQKRCHRNNENPVIPMALF